MYDLVETIVMEPIQIMNPLLVIAGVLLSCMLLYIIVLFITKMVINRKKAQRVKMVKGGKGGR